MARRQNDIRFMTVTKIPKPFKCDAPVKPSQVTLQVSSSVTTSDFKNVTNEAENTMCRIKSPKSKPSLDYSMQSKDGDNCSLEKMIASAASQILWEASGASETPKQEESTEILRVENEVAEFDKFEVHQDLPSGLNTAKSVRNNNSKQIREQQVNTIPNKGQESREDNIPVF